MSRLAGKVAIVTGGGRGIGRAVAELFAEEGARVIVGDIEDPEPFDDTRIVVRSLDVTNLPQWDQLLARVEDEHGGPDVLVNNAGLVGSYAALHEIELDDWKRIVDVNQTGTFYGMRVTVPAMKRHGGGAIVNVSSMWGIIGASGVAAYQASKGAVRLMTKNAALTYAGDNIRVNSLHPGIVDTPMIRAQDADLTGEIVDATPLGRIAEPREVAYGALFLACGESSYVTGIELVIDGGFTVQ
jgi:NAD(P)-dependent dehydrogenase (short-subunit alcohol dehydrogenase family)